MRRAAGTAAPMPIPEMKRPMRIGTSVVLNPMRSSPTTLIADAEEHDLAGVAAVGERCDQHLREEPGDEPDADDHADGGFADPVLVAVVVDDGEQHAVARCQAGHQPAERDEQHPWRRRRALHVITSVAIGAG